MPSDADSKSLRERSGGPSSAHLQNRRPAKSAKEAPKKRKTPVASDRLNSGTLTRIVICLDLFQGSQIISTSKVLLT